MSDFDKKMVLLYTCIGCAINVVFILISFKDDIKSLLHSRVEQILKWLALLLLILPLGLFGYWVIYVFTYKIAQSLCKDDIVLMHILANTPSYSMIYFMYKGRKD